MSIDLVKFMEGWATQWANARGGANNIDWNRTNPIFKEYYQDYGVDIIWSMGDYNISSKSNSESAYFNTQYGPFSQDTNINFSHSMAVTDNFEWSITEEIATGVKASVSAGVPGIFSAEAGFTFDISVSSTQGQTKEKSNTWDTAVDFQLPAGDTADLEMVIVKSQATATTTMNGTLNGRIAIGLNQTYEGHYFWFVDVIELYRQYNSRGDITIIDGVVTCSIPVNFSGVAATDAHIKEKRTSPGRGNTINTYSRVSKPRGSLS
jgi:hypothetical protein